MSRTFVGGGGSYPSAEMQFVYSAVPADWATGHSLGTRSYPSAEMQLVYSTAPADRAVQFSVLCLTQDTSYCWVGKIIPLCNRRIISPNNMAKTIYGLHLYLSLPYHNLMIWRSSHGVVAKVLNCDIVVSDFDLQLRHYIHFQTNTLRKGMNLLILSSYGLNCTTTVLLQVSLLYLFKNPACIIT